MYNTIKWANIKPIYISYTEYNEYLKDCIDKKYRRLKPQFGFKKAAIVKSYSLIQTDAKDEIRICDKYNEYQRYIVKHIFEDDELKEESKITGLEAYTYVDELFKKYKHTKHSIYQAFSGNKYKETYKLIKKCVPKQIAFISGYAQHGHIITNCFKADVSSAFPSQMVKPLPTLHDCITVEGIANPNEEYPFAFYPETGHIKIYNELDTHKMKSKYYTFYNEVYNDSAETTMTILCKKSEYLLKDEFEYMYSQRSIDKNNKMYMNACIGYFHRNADPRLSMLAAVVIARNNNEMMNRVKKLESEGNLIQYIATDSIIWSGKYSNVASEDKYLGSFTYEGKNGKLFGRMIGAYQYMDESNNLTTKCSYLKNDANKLSIPFGKLPEPKGVKLIRDNKGFILNILGE